MLKHFLLTIVVGFPLVAIAAKSDSVLLTNQSTDSISQAQELESDPLTKSRSEEPLHPSPTVLSEEAPISLAPTIRVPKLSIRWNCDNCVVNEKVIPLIEKTYAEIAARERHTIADKDLAEIEIVEFRQRPPAARILLGFFAGKDNLSIKVTYKGETFVIEEYSANVIEGMNFVCESLARTTFDKLRAIAK